MPDFMTLEMDWHQFGRRLYGSGLGLDYGTETILYMQTYNRAIVIKFKNCLLAYTFIQTRILLIFYCYFLLKHKYVGMFYKITVLDHSCTRTLNAKVINAFKWIQYCVSYNRNPSAISSEIVIF